MPDQQPIIIKRVKKRHAGHHGGAWKVAYADFVTAMMAFFLVMWLVSQGPETTAAVGGYFRDPGVFTYGRGGSVVGNADGGPGAEPVSSAGADASLSDRDDWAELQRTAERIDSALGNVPEFAELRGQIEVRMTTDGLRIELMESAQTGFFDSGSAEMYGTAKEILRVITTELVRLDSPVVFEGHSDNRPYEPDAAYGNWELSTDRANAARRVMERSGLPVDRVLGVRGYADTRPRVAEDPSDARNRRVSIVVRSRTEGGPSLDDTGPSPETGP